MEDEEIPQLEEASVADASSPGAGQSRPLERRKVPITLLTGYLGAGKSTLLEYVLTAQHGYKIAICMNDFGDTTDIESKSLTLSDPITGEHTSSFLSLPNGCLCCSFKDMGIAAIEEMAAQQGVDWVMVELTGVADPGPIARSFWENEEMGDLTLDGIVCVVDCRNILQQIAGDRPQGEINECIKQIACADMILLNKTDLVTPSILQQVEETIRSINPTLRVFHTVNSRIPLKEMFDLRAYSVSDTGLPYWLSPPSPNEPHREISHQDHVHTHGKAHRHDPSHPHHNGIRTTLIPLPSLSSSQFDALNTFLEYLLWQRKLPSIASVAPITEKHSQISGTASTETAEAPEVLRTKGLVRRADNGKEYILQGVTDLFELKEIARPASVGGVAGEERTGGGDEREESRIEGKVVFIGRGVDKRLNVALHNWLNVHA